VTALLLLVTGALLTIGGTAVLSWPSAVIVAGLLLILGGVDLARDVKRPEKP
jgi:hypothetical protein